MVTVEWVAVLFHFFSLGGGIYSYLGLESGLCGMGVFTGLLSPSFRPVPI